MRENTPEEYANNFSRFDANGSKKESSFWRDFLKV
jgi:hypothetical protein